LSRSGVWHEGSGGDLTPLRSVLLAPLGDGDAICWRTRNAGTGSVQRRERVLAEYTVDRMIDRTGAVYEIALGRERRTSRDAVAAVHISADRLAPRRCGYVGGRVPAGSVVRLPSVVSTCPT
jgi:hypothetical protein